MANFLDEAGLTLFWDENIKRNFITDVEIEQTTAEVKINTKKKDGTIKTVHTIDVADSSHVGVVTPAQMARLSSIPNLYPGTGTATDGAMTQQAATNAFATKNNSALSGTPTAPTAAPGTVNTQVATTQFVDTAINTGIASAVMFRGTKNTSADIMAIPTASRGDLYICTAGAEAGDTWVCMNDISVATPTSWTKLGNTVSGLGNLAYKNGGTAVYEKVTAINTTAAATDTVYSMTNAGTLPTFAVTVDSSGTVEFTFDQGTLPSRAIKTFAKEGCKNPTASMSPETINVAFA